MWSYFAKIKTPSDVIKELEMYRNMVLEPINYTVGDYVLSKTENQPYYVLDIKNEFTTVVTLLYNKISIQTYKSYCFTKTLEYNEIQSFVNDVSVSKDIVSGVIVRCRKDHTLPIQGPFIVLHNDQGNITIAGYVEDRITEKTVKWYELALYY